MRQLDTETLATQNITSALTVLTHTPSATVATRCGLHVELSGLDGSGGTFLCYITLGGVPLQPYPMAVAWGENEPGIVQREFFVLANKEVVVQILSPNAADTSVGIVAYLFDTTPLQPVTAGRQIGVESDGDVTKVNALDGHTPQTGDVYGALPTNFTDMVIEPATRWTDIVLADGGWTMEINSVTGGFTAAMVGKYLYLEHTTGVAAIAIKEYVSTNQVLSDYPDVFYNAIFADPENPVDLTAVRGVLGGRVLLSEETHRRPDQSAITANAYITARLLGTIAAGTHVAQTGDVYAALPTNFSDMIVEPATVFGGLSTAPVLISELEIISDGAFTDALDGQYVLLKHATCQWWVGPLTYFNSNSLFASNPSGIGSLSDVTMIVGGRVGLTASYHRQPDTAAVDALFALNERLIGTIAAGTHVAQTGNNYPILSSATHGLAALKTLLDALPAAVEAALVNDGDATALLQAIADKFAGEYDIEDLTLAAIASTVAAAILVDPANKIDVDETGITKAGDGNGNVTATGTSMASRFDAVPGAVKLAMEAEGSVLDTINDLIDEGAFTEAALGNVPSGGLDAEALRDAIGLAEPNLDEQIAGIEGGVGTGTGPNAVTITVNDGTDPIESAIVSMSKGAEKYAGSTNASGVIAFSLDDGTWTVAINRGGLYSFTPTTLVVTGTATATYSMTQETISASDVDKVSCYLYVLDEDGEAVKDAIVEMQFVSYSGGTGIAHYTNLVTATSTATGLVTFTNRIPGATYRYRLGGGPKWTTVTIASNATSLVALDNVWGKKTKVSDDVDCS